MKNLPVAIAAELRKRGEKRIKSVFQNHDGSLSVFLYGDLPAGKKSFNVQLNEWEGFTKDYIMDLVITRTEEILSRPDTVPESVVPEEEYESERSS